MHERVDPVEAPTAIWRGASWWENVQNLSGRLRGNWQLKVGGSLVAAFVVIALIIPLFYDYDGEVLKHTITAKYQAPSFKFWFGTDNFGRDVFARVLWGTRTTLVIGASSVGFALALGVPLGMLSGYWGRWRDEAMMRVNDAFMCLPGLMLALLLVSVLGSNLWNAILAIGITYIPRVVRVVRSATIGLKNEEFIIAARARGESDAYIVFQEILPNIWTVVIVEAGIRIGFAIILGAALSYLGLGVQPPAPGWGLMIYEARKLIFMAPWTLIFPSVFLALIIISFNILGDGLRRLLDPRERRDELI